MPSKQEIQQLRKKRLELIRQIKICEHYKQRLLTESEKLEASYQAGKISAEEYEQQKAKILKDKTLQEWKKYFDKTIAESKQQIKALNLEIHQPQRLSIPTIAATLVFALITALAILQPQITGYLAASPGQYINETISLPVNQFVTNDSYVEISFQNSMLAKPVSELISTNVTSIALENQTAYGYALLELQVNLGMFQLIAPAEPGVYDLNIALKNSQISYAVTTLQIEVSQQGFSITPAENISLPAENITVPEPALPENITPPEIITPPESLENITLPTEPLPEETLPENTTQPENTTAPEGDVISRLRERLKEKGLRLENVTVVDGKYNLEIVQEITTRDHIFLENLTEEEIEKLDVNLKSKEEIIYVTE